ncbi:hypothetical protein [Spirochaeta africana]|uniref:Uncharacterized protein n=1 Tax=Spirochaeta africana (strain ATCC 700263 / DSM 8902 / Z-7692) TaxID=889378 RepID=H9UJE6_SPIAZ|nr:hypothetical protein [Spirochaeta africana]AFG37639.1 hypothetical protein Spiaf_1580 [Spirochaeta africana DSM 8902]
MPDLTDLDRRHVDPASIKSRLPKRYKDQLIAFLETLQQRQVLFAEDVAALEGAFQILRQADDTLKTIRKLQRLETQAEDIDDVVKVDNALSKNRSLYSRLIGQYNAITKDYFATPAAKVKVIDQLGKKHDDPDNPILGVLGDG